MGGRKKRGNASGNNGKQSKARRGEQAKQVKEAQTKEMETKGIRQTKLDFITTGSPEKVTATTSPKNVIATPSVPPNDKVAEKTVQTKKLSFAEAIGTPPKAKAANDTNKSTAITPEPKIGPTVTLKKTTTTQAITRKETNKTNNDQNELEEEDNKKPAAKTTTELDSAHNKKLPGTQAAPTATRSTKNNKKTETTTTTTNEGTYNTPKKYRAIRYNGLIETQPSDKPFEDFVALLKEYFKIIQDILGKDIYIAAWDNEQSKAFPPIKKPSKLPASRESLGIYLGTYVNPKSDGSKVYLNLRLVTMLPHHVPLERFGMELADQFASSKHRMTIHRQPRPCQAAKSECIGWMMYSCKSMSSATVIPAVKKVLNIPEDVEIGIQYRTISNEHGKKPAFNRDDPPAAAIHLDIDERYALVYQARAASLWRKNSKKRLPNGVQLRLVPCFTSATGKSMTDTQRSDAMTLAERQYYFVKEHLKMLPAYFFISQLDTPISEENNMTLRRAMMSQAPAKQATARLIHNVDAAWNQTTKHAITTVVGREQEAQRFLVNMIPEYLHRFGEGATKWFTGAGLLVYKDVKWNPTKGTTSSAKEHESEEMVKEDLWGLNDKWEELKKTKASETTRPDASTLDATGEESIISTPTADESKIPGTTRLGSDKSIASFGNVFQRNRDDDDAREEETIAKEEAAKIHDITGTQFEFS